MTETYLSGITRHLEQVADVAYSVGCGLNTSASWQPKSTFPIDWIKVYMERGYQKIDPVIKFSCEGRGALNWRDLPSTEESRKFLEHSGEFGLKNGTVFASVVQGLKCSVSVCHSKETLTDAEIEILQEYTIAYGSMYPRKNASPRDEVRLKYLNLQGNGASGSQIQTALGLSARSLAELKKDAVAEMSAKSLPQAISSAMSANLI